MSRHDDSVSMQDMLDHAREAADMLRGKTRSDLDDDRMLQLALTRLVEIVGEAAARVSGQTRQRESELPWPEIIGMRNRLVHGYDVIDLDVLWDTVVSDLPPLIAKLERILADQA